MRRQHFFLFFTVFLCFSANATISSVPIYLFELKPLVYHGENNEIKGAWFDSFQELAKKSGLKFNYQFVSIPRIELLLAGKKPGCNLTFLKTKSRAEKANFIYNHAVKTIIKTYQRADDPRKWTLKKLQEDKAIKIVTNSSVAVEALNEKKIPSELLFNINSIIQMLMIKRIDIYVGSNLAVETMDEFKNGKIKAGIVVKKLVHGIACSHGTSEDIIAKIKKGAKSWQLVAPKSR